MIKDIADYVNGNMKTLENLNRVVEIDVALGGECKVCILLSLIIICIYFYFYKGFSSTSSSFYW